MYEEEFFFLIKMQLIYNVLVSGVQQRGSVIYIYFLYILFNYGLLQDIENTSLCYKVGPSYLSVYMQQLTNKV